MTDKWPTTREEAMEFLQHVGDYLRELEPDRHPSDFSEADFIACLAWNEVEGE